MNSNFWMDTILGGPLGDTMLISYRCPETTSCVTLSAITTNT